MAQAASAKEKVWVQEKHRVLAKFRIRSKLLIALLPLALMVLAATLYSSIEMSRIDKRYSMLIARDVKALQSLTDARAKTTAVWPEPL